MRDPRENPEENSLTSVPGEGDPMAWENRTKKWAKDTDAPGVPGMPTTEADRHRQDGSMPGGESSEKPGKSPEQLAAEKAERIEVANNAADMIESFISEPDSPEGKELQGVATAVRTMVKFPNTFNNLEAIQDPKKKAMAEKMLNRLNDAKAELQELIDNGGDFAKKGHPALDELNKIKGPQAADDHGFEVAA